MHRFVVGIPGLGFHLTQSSGWTKGLLICIYPKEREIDISILSIQYTTPGRVSDT